MADNTVLDPGTGGDTIATDDVGGVKYQIVKHAFGPLDTATLVEATVGLPTDVLDRSARDLGKVDIAMGQAAHDAAGAAIDPVAIGGYASAAAPTNVSADVDIVRAWFLRNGAQAQALAQILNVVSTANSSTATLGVSGVFTGTSEDVRDYSSINVNIFSDVASATDGISLQWSSNGTNWDHTETYNLSAGVGFSIQASTRAQFFRIVFTNGGTGQGVFRLQTIYKIVEPVPRKTRLLDPPSGQDPGILTQSVIVGQAPGGSGTLNNAKITSNGSLRTDTTGQIAHDALASVDPLLIGGYASAAAPAAVSADGDATNAWFLRNGAQATVLTAAGALIGGDAANGLDVDVTRLPALVAGSANIGDVDVLTVPAPLSTTGGGTEATALRVTIANDSTGVVSVDDNTGSLTVDLANVENATLVDNAAFTDGTTRLVMAGHIFDDTAGTALTENDAAAARISSNRATVCAIEDGATRARYATVTAANAVKVDGSAVTQPVSGNVGTLPLTTGGCSSNHLVSAASTNATNVKASAGQVYGWNIFNTNASIRYVKLHNTAGTPTAGSGVVRTIGVPGNGGNNYTSAHGITFATGIAFTTVTGAADSDATGVGANDLTIDIDFK